jgi:hypothetical protein
VAIFVNQAVQGNSREAEAPLDDERAEFWEVLCVVWRRDWTNVIGSFKSESGRPRCGEKEQVSCRDVVQLMLEGNVEEKALINEQISSTFGEIEGI